MERRDIRARGGVVATILACLSIAINWSSAHAHDVGQLEAKSASQPVFRAGAAMSNITPPLGEPIVRNFATPAATYVHDELHARCLVLNDGETRLAFAICDNVGIARDVFDAARKYFKEATGLPPENLLMAATHTHSGTSASGKNSMKTDSELSEYQRFLARRISDGIRRAVNNLEPARIGWGSVDVPSQLFNRRWFLKPGGTPLRNPFGGQDRVIMNPTPGDPNLVEPAGPTDPQVSFLSVRSRNGRPIALLANYSLHYVGGVPVGHISADYFAVFADRIQKSLGADRMEPPFVAMMSNGTSGDVNNINFRLRGARRAPYEKIAEIAGEVAQAVVQTHSKIQFRDWVPLSAAHGELALAVRKPNSYQLTYIRQVLASPEIAKPYHPLERVYAQRAMKLHESPDQVSIMLQTFRIGDVGIAAIPFEVFTETGLEIKQRSPFKPTFTVELANGSYGYLPTPRQHALGGYETWMGTSNVEIEASDTIVKTLLSLLERLRQ